MNVGHFLAGIGALVWHPATDTYLLLQRAGQRDFGAGMWECVTGRVDQGEGFAQALVREVREEIGVAVQFEYFLGVTHFYRGATRPENELVGILCCCSLARRESIQISDEHAQYRWLSASEALALLPAENWLAEIIRRAEAIRGLAPVELRAYWRRSGLSID